MNQHYYIRSYKGKVDLISEDGYITTIRHIQSPQGIADTSEREITENAYEAIMNGDYTIDRHPLSGWMTINGEVSFPTLHTVSFFPRFISRLPAETLQILRVAGIERDTVKLYAYKGILWVQGQEIAKRVPLPQQIGNFCFQIPSVPSLADIPPLEVTNIEIYKDCGGYDYLHIETSDVDVYINIVQIM